MSNEARVAALVLAVSAIGALSQLYAASGERETSAPAVRPRQPLENDDAARRPTSAHTMSPDDSGPSVEASRLLEPGGRIDVNRAAPADLELLPRVGPVLARRIVADRESRGPFASLRDLERVKGLGPKTIARFRHLIEVGAPSETGASLAREQ